MAYFFLKKMIKPRKAKNESNKRERTEPEKEEKEDEIVVAKTSFKEEPPRKKLHLDNSIKTDKGERVNLDEYLSNTFKASKEMRTSAFDATAINTLEFDETDSDKQSSSETKSKQSLLNNELHGRGPQKGSKFIRVTARFDFEPNICKDYYETGFCGYGLNCIYAHYREEYKSGNQVEKEWREEQKKKQDSSSTTTTTTTTPTSDLPFACHICRKEFTDPVVTICKHYFCSKCALDRYNGGKNPKCAVCGQNTQGIFNTAHALKKKKIVEQRDETENEWKV